MSAAPSGAPARRVPAAAWGLVLALALTLRLAAAAQVPHVILWPDGREFEAVARGLLAHGSYGTQTLRAPGYPTFIAAVYAVLGPDLGRLRVVECVVGTLSVGAVGAGCAALFGPLAGLLAALVAALTPVLVLLPATQFSENLLMLMVTLALIASFAAWRRGGWGGWALAGALWGLAMLVRPNIVLLLPGLALGLGLALRRARRSWLGPAVLCALVSALVLAPWVVRNYQVHHRWFFVTTGGGRQLWLGNNLEATGASNSLTRPDSTMRAEMARLPDDAARERYLYRRALAFVREHPGRAARLYLIKLGNMFELYPETYTRTDFVAPWARAAQSLASLVLFAGVLLGLRGFGRTPALWPLVGAVASFALANAAFFTVMRYRVAFEPCLLWLAGRGWAALLGERKVSR